jgi:hypothetical protein
MKCGCLRERDATKTYWGGGGLEINCTCSETVQYVRAHGEECGTW